MFKILLIQLVGRIEKVNFQEGQNVTKLSYIVKLL